MRVAELQEEQLAIHQQATAAAAANKQVTIESLIAEAEAARAKAMSEKGGAAAAVSALTAKAKLAGMWREKVDQHNTGSPVIERIERVIVHPAPRSNDVGPSLSEPRGDDADRGGAQSIPAVLVQREDDRVRSRSAWLLPREERRGAQHRAWPRARLVLACERRFRLDGDLLRRAARARSTREAA